MPKAVYQDLKERIESKEFAFQELQSSEFQRLKPLANRLPAIIYLLD